MTQQNLNLGTGNDSGNGDTLRAGMTKVEANTTELFSRIKLSAAADPTVNDDITNYVEGTLWIRQDNNKAWLLVDNTDGAAVWAFIGIINADGMVFPKASGTGIKVDIDSPTYGWGDIIGALVPKSGVNRPTYKTYRGSIDAYAFSSNDIIDFIYHLPHDYAPGTDLFIHVHWSHNGTSISGTAEFTHYTSYAKGHNQEIFPSEVSNAISFNTVDIATTPRYSHRIDEIQLSNVTGTGSFLETGDIEVDGLILTRLQLTGLPSITAGDLFIHTVDIHYQSNLYSLML